MRHRLTTLFVLITTAALLLAIVLFALERSM